MLDWERYQPRLGAVGRSRWPRGQRTTPAWHLDTAVPDNHDLWFIWSGRGSIRLRTGWTELRPGICIWMRPVWRYDVVQDPNDPLCLNFIHFDLVDVRGKLLPLDAPLPPEFHEPPDPQVAEAITRRIVEMFFGFSPHGYVDVANDKPSTIVGQRMLTALLVELDIASDPAKGLGGIAQRHRRAIEQAACRIMESPREMPSVGELSKHAGYSVDHFIRLFRKVTGLAPRKFAMRARLRLAQRLLRETDLSVGEIANAAARA